jgi:hypothetical protein
VNALTAAVEFIRARNVLALTDQYRLATTIHVQYVHDTARALDDARRPHPPAEELVPRVDPALLLTAPTVVVWRHDCGTTLAIAAARKPRLCSICGIGRRGIWRQTEDAAA